MHLSICALKIDTRHGVITSGTDVFIFCINVILATFIRLVLEPLEQKYTQHWRLFHSTKGRVCVTRHSQPFLTRQAPYNVFGRQTERAGDNLEVTSPWSR